MTKGEKKSKWLLRILIMALACALLVGLCSCGGNTDPASDILYGDEADTDDDDDILPGASASGESTSSTGGTGSTGKTENEPGDNPGNNGTTTTGSNGGGVLRPSSPTRKPVGSGGIISGPSHSIDEGEKTDFLASVPKSLSGSTVKILIWWQPGTAEVAKMKKFSEATGIKIEWVTSGGEGEYLQKLSSMKVAGAPADLACIRGNNFPNVLLQGYFQPLSAGKMDYSDSDIYDIDAMKQFTMDGEVYGALVKNSSMAIFNVLYYNEDMFDRVGMTTPRELWEAGNWNWDTFRELCVEAKSKMGVAAAVTCEYHGHVLVETSGESYCKLNNGKLVNNMSSQKVASAVAFINDLRDTSKVLDMGINKEGWIAQECPMHIDGNFMLQKGDYLDQNAKFNFNYAPLPSPAGSPLTVSAGLQMYGFPSGSENAEAAAYALQYWWSSEFDEKGSERWINDDAAAFVEYLWNQPKCFDTAGIVSYDGSYEVYDLYAALGSCGSANVRSTLDSWSSVIEGNINKMNREFGS